MRGCKNELRRKLVLLPSSVFLSFLISLKQIIYGHIIAKLMLSQVCGFYSIKIFYCFKRKFFIKIYPYNKNRELYLRIISLEISLFATGDIALYKFFFMVHQCICSYYILKVEGVSIL